MLVKAIHVGPIGTNCYLLGDETAKVCCVVDPGDEAPAIRKMIEDTGCTLQMLLLTHGHYDHTTAIPDLRNIWPDVPVYIHRSDAASGGVKAPLLFPATPNTIFYGEGDTLTLGALTIEVLHTPGHSKGSVTLKVGDVLFTGDTLFQGSMGRTDLSGGSYEEIMASLKRLATLSGDYHVCPGHEGRSTLEVERKQNYYLREALEG